MRASESEDLVSVTATIAGMLPITAAIGSLMGRRRTNLVVLHNQCQVSQQARTNLVILHSQCPSTHFKGRNNFMKNSASERL